MPKLPGEQLNRLTLVALVLAEAGATDTPIADSIPQEAWDELHERGLIDTTRDIDGDGWTGITPIGSAALAENLEYEKTRIAWGVTR